MKHTNYAPMTVILLGLGALGFGCATASPTDHLVDARDHYEHARNGVAQKYQPDLVHDASVALADAEQMHDRKPGSEAERHLAYIADRKALLASSEGRLKAEQANIQDATAERERVLLAQRDNARTQADQTSDQLGETKRDLEEERKARLAREEELKAAMASLAEIAKIKAEEKETVITLSGEVLFKTAEAELLPLAQQKLAAVARVLRTQDNKKDFVVEGHTDDRGKDSYNESLSLQRAQAVRTYLVSEGVDPNRIRAVGRGEEEPVASNDSAEGRANNRRVEIVVADRTTTASAN